MDKMPRKEDLLRSQQLEDAIPLTPASKDISLAQKAKEEAEIAESHSKKIKFEIEAKLQEHGYKSVELAMADLAKKHDEADRIITSIKQREEVIEKDRLQVEQEKQKVINAYAIVKDREKAVDAKMNEVGTIHQSNQTFIIDKQKLINELNDKVDFHNENIHPCIMALKRSAKAIYDTWNIIENHKQYDKDSIQEYINERLNYVGKQTEIVEKYIDRMKVS